MKGAADIPGMCFRRRLKLSRRTVQYFASCASLFAIFIEISRSRSSSCAHRAFASACAAVSSANSAIRTSWGTPPVATIHISGMNATPSSIIRTTPICPSSCGKKRIASLKVYLSYDSKDSGSKERTRFTISGSISRSERKTTSIA